MHELNEAGARLAREVADGCGALVLGSMGPTGDLMEPLGVMTHDACAELYAEQAAGLAAGGAHILLAETFSDLGEVRAAVEGARRGAPGLPVAVTMTFDLKGHTMMGVSPLQALEGIAELGVEMIGGNCGSGPEEIENVMMVMTANRLKPENASCGVSTPVARRPARTRSATRSARMRPDRNRKTAAPRMATVKSA